jgi:hypothetical protein
MVCDDGPWASGDHARSGRTLAREVNRVIEETAWGGYRTEFYPTYDDKAIAEEQRKPGQ